MLELPECMKHANSVTIIYRTAKYRALQARMNTSIVFAKYSECVNHQIWNHKSPVCLQIEGIVLNAEINETRFCRVSCTSCQRQVFVFAEVCSTCINDSNVRWQMVSVHQKQQYATTHHTGPFCSINSVQKQEMKQEISLKLHSRKCKKWKCSSDRKTTTHKLVKGAYRKQRTTASQNQR